MISNEDILHLAKLARLQVPEADVAGYRTDLEAILGYVNKLKELDTEGVPEMAHADGAQNVWREDVAAACPADEREAMIKAFPVRSGDLLEVQAVFANRTE